MVWVSSKLNFPPNTCMPSSEKMMIKRKSSSSRDAMDFMELRREATRLLSDCQWLGGGGKDKEIKRDEVKTKAKCMCVVKEAVW